ncbi:MAG: multiprotein bridging factor aMBF1 [Candidatus Thorarchaeota archaeon]
MPSCELCGRDMKGAGRDVTIEGADMLVCPQCAAKFGGHTMDSTSKRIHSAPRKSSWIGSPSKPSRASPTSAPPRVGAKRKPKPRGALLDEMILIEDYAQAIRGARQKRNLNQDELAQKVGERVSTLQGIESGRLKPTKKTIRGLERELEISLLESVGPVPIKSDRVTSGGSPTLGDVVRIKRKKSQKDAAK